MSSFKEIFSPFVSSKLVNSNVIWINENYRESIDWSSSEFLRKYSFALAESDCFVDLEFDDNNQITMLAEQYGGYGIGGNGGGVRCGNLDDCQIKGIGMNHVVGDHDDFDHSSGMYPLFEAVTEAINSAIYSHILPVGTVNYYGVISIGSSTHNRAENKPRTKLALGVRDRCLRPAHFLRAEHFKPRAGNGCKVYSDVPRTRALNKGLKEYFKTNEAFISYLGKFLSKCANQFAFGKVFGISHGAVSPSNISFDSLWLDLTNATFVPDGVNYSASEETVPFFNEPAAIIDIIQQLAYQYSKYNKVSFNLEPLINYYYRELELYANHYISLLFGLDLSITKDQWKHNKYPALVKGYLSLLQQNSSAKVGFPNSIENTEIICDYIRNLFVQVSSFEQENESPCESTAESELASIVKLFLEINPAIKSFSNAVKVLTIKSLRKRYFAPIFYIGRIHCSTKSFIADNCEEYISKYIDKYSNAAKWLFNENESIAFSLFENESIEIHFNVESERYYINDLFSGSRLSEESAVDILSYINTMDDFIFDVASYNGKVSLVKLLIAMSNIEAEILINM